MRALSIVVPVFNKYKFTKSCIDDLTKLPSTHEIIIVDDCSTDETREQLEGSKEIKYIRNDKNSGFAATVNNGYKNAESSNVLFLNNDIKVVSNHSDWTKELIEDCDKYIVGPTMGLLDNSLNFIKEQDSFIPGNFSYMSGWCLASSKKIFNQLIINKYPGPFSQEFFCYFEDTDLSFRARRMKIQFKVNTLPLVHFGKVSSKQLNTHKLYSESRKIFVQKWKNK